MKKPFFYFPLTSTKDIEDEVTAKQYLTESNLDYVRYLLKWTTACSITFGILFASSATYLATYVIIYRNKFCLLPTIEKVCYVSLITATLIPCFFSLVLAINYLLANREYKALYHRMKK